MRNYFFLVLTLFIQNGWSQTISPAEECSDCHQQIYTEWKSSRHAHSSEAQNVFFQKMLDWANKSSQNSLDETCRKCHEPARTLIPDTEQTRAVFEQGVSCDICHATQLAVVDNYDWIQLGPGNLKYGPIKDPISNVHESEFSASITTSEFCFTCHGNEKNPHGISFCSTKSEWENSRFARQGVSCQDCHMPSKEGKAAPLGKVRDEIHSHSFFGGYSDEILTNCADIKVKYVRKDSLLDVAVEIQNHAVGHALPTGSPMRMVIFNIEAQDADKNPVWKNYYINPIKEDPQAIFMKLLANENGDAPVPPWEAVTEKFDQRLLPDEKRLLTYLIPDSNVVYLETTLTYRLAPPPLLKKLGIEDEEFKQAKLIKQLLIKVAE